MNPDTVCTLPTFDTGTLLLGIAVGLALGIAAALIARRALDQDDFPADALTTLQQRLAAKDAEAGQLERERLMFRRERNLAEARATAAEAERDALRAAAERYLRAVASLGEGSGYNYLTYFETPILKAPTDEIGEECSRRWLELNDAGKALRAALFTTNAGGGDVG